MAFSSTHPRDLKAKFLEKFSILTPDDAGSCCVSGLVCMPDDRIVCLDNNNMKMKVFCPECSFLFSTDIEKDSCGIALLSQFEVAVCCGPVISRYVIGQNEAKKRRQETQIGENAVSMSYVAGKYAVMCKNKSKSIKILNEVGNVIDTLTVSKVISDPVDLNEFLSLDKSGERLYLTTTKGQIICINLNGKLVWNIRMAELPISLLQVDNTAILVFCANPSKIVCIDSSGIIMNTLMESQPFSNGAHGCRQKRSVFVSSAETDFLMKIVLFSK